MKQRVGQLFMHDDKGDDAPCLIRRIGLEGASSQGGAILDRQKGTTIENSAEGLKLVRRWSSPSPGGYLSTNMVDY
jgi:hypothetical protein